MTSSEHSDHSKRSCGGWAAASAVLPHEAEIEAKSHGISGWLLTGAGPVSSRPRSQGTGLRKALKRGLRMAERRRLRRLSWEDESRRKAVDGHAQQHPRGLTQEHRQSVQTWAGAEDIDFGMDVADVDNQSVQRVRFRIRGNIATPGWPFPLHPPIRRYSIRTEPGRSGIATRICCNPAPWRRTG